jgi:hypothetical protein
MAIDSPIPDRATELRGRRAECAVLDRLIDAVRGGESRVLVLRGEPGVGKTALLDYVVEQASALRVTRAAGVQSETELAFAALHQLLEPMLDRPERLPVPQRDALHHGIGAAPVIAWDLYRVADGRIVELAVQALLIDGEFVLTQSEGTARRNPVIFYDLWRLEHGLIAEHWDVIS